MLEPAARLLCVAEGEGEAEFFAAFDFCGGEHGAAAIGGVAEAGLVVLVGIVEVVFVGELFAGVDVAEGEDEDALVGFFGDAVGGAAVIDEHGGTEAVDDLAVVADGEEVGDVAFGVALVCGGFGEAGAVVFEDACALADGREGVAAGAVDGGGADEELGAGHGWEYSRGSPGFRSACRLAGV